MCWSPCSLPGSFTLQDIDGKDTPLSKFQGKVALVVNLASACGFTPQYAELQGLYNKYSSKGLVVLGFPCNQVRLLAVSGRRSDLSTATNACANPALAGLFELTRLCPAYCCCRAACLLASQFGAQEVGVLITGGHSWHQWHFNTRDFTAN